MIYMFLADGFEEIEALAPLDLMRRAGLSVTTVGIDKKDICGAHGITVVADITDKNFSADSLDMVFLPGGMPGTLNLSKSPVVIDAIKTAADQNAYIAAICAAPSILGDMGLLVGKRAVCYPGFESRLVGAEVPTNEKVVVDEKIITAKGMGAAIEMGLKIIELLCSKEKAEELKHAVIAD
jgi:4-methyl-5(b-hydroxyethyl)-thiazole monophosphate biosynthesis